MGAKHGPIILSLALLMAACARTTEEWADDVRLQDPFRYDLAVAALGRAPSTDVGAATRALLELTSFRNATAQGQFVDSLQRLCRTDLDAVLRACSEAELNAEMSGIVRGAVEAARHGPPPK